MTELTKQNPIVITTDKRNMSQPSIPGGLKWQTDPNPMDKSEKGNFLPNLSNARRMVTQHPLLSDCFGWSEMDEDVMIMRELPWFEGIAPPRSLCGYPCRMEDKYVTYLRDLMSSVLDCNFNRNDVMQACSIAGMQRTYNPIRQYLQSLTWDEQPRITEWLKLGFGAADTSLNSSIAFMFLIAAVRRVIFRRYKFDSMLVLEGAKGIMKSSGVRELFGHEYFLEGIADIRRDQTVQLLAGMWGVEIPEGKGFIDADAATQKEFLSKVEDTYRRPFAIRPVTVPRSVVFIMTTNEHMYMNDGSGDRRFWNVLCNVTQAPDMEWIKTNRDQLWAEAYHMATQRNEDGSLRYKTYMEPSEMESLTAEQESRVTIDPWEDVIRGYLSVEPGANQKEISSAVLFRDVLDLPIDRQDRKAAMKVGRIMQDLGWGRRQRRNGTSREWVYARE